MTTSSAALAAPDALILARPGLHELHVAGADAAAAAALALLLGGADGTARPILWVRQAFLDRECGLPSPRGVAELGLDPVRLLLVRTPDALGALRAGLEGARCAALAAVAIELWGEAPAYDLTASRRLMLAARETGALLLLVRIAATPRPSAALSRWSVAAAPSRGLAANAPGAPAFRLRLLRARDGREGIDMHVEWDRDRRIFRRLAAGAEAGGAAAAGRARGGGAALSGAVSPLPAGGAAPPLRRAG